MKATAELKMLPVSVLKPAAYNPRKKLKPGDKEYEKIKNSIEEFGFADPLVVNADKNYSPQVLKANMKIVGATEYALVLYRGKLPKFNNVGEDGKSHMIFNWFDWKRDGKLC